MTSQFQCYLERITVWGCGSLLGMLASDVVLGSYNAGISPLKPSLFTFGTALFCLSIAVVSKPRFCPAAFWILLLPLVRFIDTGLLGRFAFSGSGEVTMSCLRILLVAVSMIAVLSTPSGLKAARWAAILAILLTSGSVLAEFAGLVRFSSIPGRAAGFNGHPNSPPIIICQALGLVFALNKNFRWNMALIAVGIPGVALTYGRSGMVIFAFLTGWYILVNARRNIGFLILCSYALLPLLVIGFTFMQQATGSGVRQDKNTAGRLQAIYELDFEKLKSPERAKDLADAWEGVMQEPAWGHGVGSASTRWAPHNEYVAMWLELGVPGLLLYLSIVWGLALRSLLSKGQAWFAVLGYLAYTPIAQERVLDPHFYLSLLTIAHVLWPQRFSILLQSPSVPSAAAPVRP